MAEGLSAARFAREIRLAAARQEPHIVSVLSCSSCAGVSAWVSRASAAAMPRATACSRVIDEVEPESWGFAGVLTTESRALPG
jgi:hypothetical protein